MDLIPGNKLLDLTGKVAIVTGAIGIGEGIAYRLAEAGAKVMVVSHHQAESDKTAQEFRDKGWIAQGIQADVSNEAEVKNMVEATMAAFGQIDILVNNAGIYPQKPVMQMQLADFEQVLAVNLKGVFLCTKYVAEKMIARGVGGKIINVSSIDALHPSSIGLAHYDASKHGVWGFTKNVALELAPHHITVTAIAPGGINTPGATHPAPSATPAPVTPADPAAPVIDMQKMIEKFLAKIPMHRMGEPDDIGKVALFLASDMSSYMTGTQVVVDGGVLLS